MRSTDAATEMHVIRFRSRAGYESFMVDPDRLEYRTRLGDAAPNTHPRVSQIEFWGTENPWPRTR